VHRVRTQSAPRPDSKCTASGLKVHRVRTQSAQAPALMRTRCPPQFRRGARVRGADAGAHGPCAGGPAARHRAQGPQAGPHPSAQPHYDAPTGVACITDCTVQIRAQSASGLIRVHSPTMTPPQVRFVRDQCHAGQNLLC